MSENLDFCFVETVDIFGGFALTGSILDEPGYEEVQETGSAS